ncbi:MAG: MerR family transcriptional regulator [Anaerolineales bacterium]|nr:MerR family transcriptional regulator [Anaerolineales bacterium]MCB9127089.1 MerR family transcriptional regulator [Ardenticatenales bacterium]
MNAMRLDELALLPDNPRYNIKAISEQTGVNVSTLRAWESRYGFPEPHRSESGHRRYSERDVALVKWLRHRTDEGVTISQAVDLLQHQLAQSPILPPVPPASTVLTPASQTPTRTEISFAITALLDALSDVNFQEAQRLFEAVCQSFPLEVALLDVFQPLMVEVGERWLNGTMHVTGEQLGTTLLRQWLLSKLQTERSVTHPVRIICGCAPDEQHDLGLLMLALLLQRRGHEILFLGANMSLSGLTDLLQRLSPAVLCVSVSLIEHVPDLLRISEMTNSVATEGYNVALVYGGHAFERHPALLAQMPGHFIGNDLATATSRVHALAGDVAEGRIGKQALSGWLRERGSYLADEFEFAKDRTCGTVALKLAEVYPELGQIPGRPNGTPWREQIYSETPRRFHLMLQVVLRCQALDVIEQEYRWAWNLLPRFGIRQEHLLSQVKWYFESMEELIGVERRDRVHFESFKAAVTERVWRSTGQYLTLTENAA